MALYESGIAVRYVTQEPVAREARALVVGAARTLDIASPWVEGFPVQRLLAEALPRIRAGELAVRIVYRVAEEGDLRITDLTALDALAADGVEIRYSRRLHAKLLIADGERALIGSSNLTRRGGFGYESRPEWRNEEGGVLVEGEPALADAVRHFEETWAGASEIAPGLLGVVIDYPSVREFRFVAVREVAAGQLVAASDGEGRMVVGEVVELTTYNHSFPQMTQEMFLTQGFGAAPPQRVTVPDIPSLFSHPVKDQGFLVAKTYFRPESAFSIGRVRVLRALERGRPVAATAPVAPGSDVAAPAAGLLRRLLGDGDVRLGRMQRHPEVGVWLRSGEILTKHLAVLGMTGSGKSNAVKHLLRELTAALPELRVFVVDTHGEYLEPGALALDVAIPDKIDLLDWEMVRDRFSVERMTAQIKKACAKRPPPPATRRSSRGSWARAATTSLWTSPRPWPPIRTRSASAGRSRGSCGRGRTRRRTSRFPACTSSTCARRRPSRCGRRSAPCSPSACSRTRATKRGHGRRFWRWTRPTTTSRSGRRGSWRRRRATGRSAR
ncbi:MAG TPA: DUF87 domain-containing protein [Gaiellaceae bacterium]|nr:DUF87 domain-containing protein [Gaiellaceae bacterium]